MKKYAFLSLLAVLALGACDDDDPTGNPGEAQVRVVNATTTSGTTTNNFATVGAFRGNTQIVGGIGSGTASTCSETFEVPAGQQTIHFRTPGNATQHAAVQHNFQANQSYTIVLYGTNNTVQARVFPDVAANATTGNRRLRFINASANATAGDVYARPSTATGSPTGAATASNMGSGQASDYFNVATANNMFEFYNTGTTTTPRQSLTLSTTGFPTSGNAMVLFTDTGAFQVNACS